MNKKEVRYRFVFENEDQLNQNLSKIKEIHGLVVETRKEIEQLNSKYPGGGAPAPRYSISCLPAPKEKCITSRVVIKGAVKVRKKIRRIKAEYQELDEVIRSLNKNLKQLKKSMKEFNEL